MEFLGRGLPREVYLSVFCFPIKCCAQVLFPITISPYKISNAFKLLSLLSLRCINIISTSGVLRDVAEPHILIRLLYLDRISKELEISLEQLHQTSQLKMYFCDIAKMCYELEQQTEYYMTQYCGLSILDKVTTIDKVTL